MYYLAIDIGASSGRHILGSYENGRIVTEEVYRFPNGNIKKEDGTLIWDVEAMFSHIKAGLAAAAKMGKTPAYVGIDTWGVDFALLDKNDNRIGDVVGYRDSRTAGMEEEVFKLIPERELYERTGIQKAVFNTVYQLMAVKKKHPEYLEQAETLLMMPCYLNYLLTGVKCNEYTHATTGQLVSAAAGTWDFDVIDRLGYPRRIFGELRDPGYVVGELTPEIQKETGCVGTKVILPATHDTGSAVVSVPTNRDDVIFLSSGTWSLIGVERMTPDTSIAPQTHNFTNEGGFGRRFRFLKNITGLWMIQSMKKELGGDYTFDILCDMAKEYDGTPLRIDVNDDRFLAPASMIQEVKAAAGKSDLSIGEMFAVVYHSLAECYKQSVAEIEEITGKSISAIHIVGGGCKDDFLCRLTAEKCGKPVFAGPVEATAIGNLTAQMISTGVFADLAEARNVIYNSFDVKEIRL